MAKKNYYRMGHEAGQAYQQVPVEDVPDPLSGEWAGESMNELLGDGWDEDDAAAYEQGYWDAVEFGRAVMGGNPVQRGRMRSIFGNPGEGTLHEAMAQVEDWLAYEAEVVRQAAAEIDDPGIVAAAEEQADQMDEAADALEQAQEAAQETAAEVFTGGNGEASADAPGPEGETVRGNPGEVLVTNSGSRYPLSADDLERFADPRQEEALPDGWRVEDADGNVLYGNLSGVPVVRGNPVDSFGEVVPIFSTRTKPLSMGGTSDLIRIYGSGPNGDDPPYEVVLNQGDSQGQFDDLESAHSYTLDLIRGNPGGPPPAPLGFPHPDPVSVAPPTPPTPDVPPDQAHWYTRPLRRTP